MAVEKVWIGGEWREAATSSTFSAENPSTGVRLPGKYPVSAWTDCDAALDAAVEAARALRSVSGDDIAAFLDGYADEIEGSGARSSV